MLVPEKKHVPKKNTIPRPEGIAAFEATGKNVQLPTERYRLEETMLRQIAPGKMNRHNGPERS